MTTPDAPPQGPSTDGRVDAATASAALPRGVVVLLGMAAAVITAAGLQSISWLVGPAFLALVIVIAVAPVQRWFQRRGWPQWAITIVLVLAVYAVVVVLALTIIVSIARLATELPQYAAQSQAPAQSGADLLARFGVGPQELQHIRDSLDVGKLAGLLGTLLSSVAGLAGNLVFVLALLLFLSIETGTAGARIRLIAADRPAVGGALTGFAHGTRQYLIVSTVFGLTVAVLDTIAPRPEKMVVVIIVYCVLNFVVQSLIQPRFVGDAVGLSVTVTFLAPAFWTWLIGPLGAILAIPLTLLAKALLVDIDPRAGWAGALLRSGTNVADASTSAPAAKTEPPAPATPLERAPG